MHRKDVVMEQPLKIVYRNILPAHKDVIDPIMREHAVKLDKYFPKIISCRGGKDTRAASRRRSLQNNHNAYSAA